MPYVKVWVHVVWSTKNRQPYLHKQIRPKVFEHIKTNAEAKGIHIDVIGGHKDHVHCLISLNPGQSMGETIQLLKGESSAWINKSGLSRFKFGWQRDYFAVSVGKDQIARVRRYILRQEEHHKKIKFSDEFQAFLIRAGFH
ncbi:MAG: IS200/IS605 family transposase [Acidobacteria bacterium]|nr:MAG: IS200/IS605 family transposase [Acidobacteriota bacterium]REK03140.1 MAG: IS200/IS605 family transposase [Acidobacteriota bacterium]REK15404.1 MAG: IS200/IS605 family transposase [Acidobacteriota bacterium]REK42123.1 MAG: IS200/IS605 family transposase [Acidobacteriota bacterium]